MTMALKIEAHLDRVGVDYEMIDHPHSSTSLQTARVAHVPAQEVAKAVMTHDGNNYRMCVIPSTHRLELAMLNKHIKGKFRLATEEELGALFEDCEVGAVPALGQVYGLPVIWDQRLASMKEVYLEGGDHESLIHLNQGAFMELMGLQEHCTISLALIHI